MVWGTHVPLALLDFLCTITFVLGVQLKSKALCIYERVERVGLSMDIQRRLRVSSAWSIDLSQSFMGKFGSVPPKVARERFFHVKIEHIADCTYNGILAVNTGQSKSKVNLILVKVQ